MEFEIRLIVDSERFEVLMVEDCGHTPEELLSETVSNLQSLNVAVYAGCVLYEGNQVAMYDGQKVTGK